MTEASDTAPPVMLHTSPVSYSTYVRREGGENAVPDRATISTSPLGALLPPGGVHSRLEITCRVARGYASSPSHVRLADAPPITSPVSNQTRLAELIFT